MEEIARRMMALFRGLEGVHGTHGVPNREGLKWAIKGTARTLREAITLDHWLKHLRGERPLGVVPIMADNTVIWSSIDADKYGEDMVAIVRRVEQSKFPLLPTLSKSGAIHLFLFTSEPVPAELAQSVLRDMAAALGLGGSEIFPKQATIMADRGDAGSWMVMPYFGDTYDGRLSPQVGLKSTGSHMTVEEWLGRADKLKITQAELQQIHRTRMEPARSPRSVGGRIVEAQAGTTEGALFADGPRCLEVIVQNGKINDKRNTTLFQIGAYLKKRHPDDWKERIEEYNRELMLEPMTLDEVQEIIKQHTKRDYGYKCHEEPFCSYCDRAVCKGRRFGIGQDGNYPDITGLTALNIPGDPLWFVDIGTGRVEVTTQELQNFWMFQRICMARLHHTYRVVSQKDWCDMVNVAMTNAVMIEPPPDVGAPAQFHELVEEFLTGHAQGKRKEDLLAGLPWLNEDEARHYFRLRDLMAFLQAEGVKELKRTDANQLIEKLGGGHHQFNFGNKTSVNVRWLPQASVQPDPPAVTDDFKGDPI